MIWLYNEPRCGYYNDGRGQLKTRDLSVHMYVRSRDPAVARPVPEELLFRSGSVLAIQVRSRDPASRSLDNSTTQYYIVVPHLID